MPVTQYIGARYVPIMANPITWSNQTSYEPLTIVLHNGNSYTSRQYVPTGIDISNTDYWAETGNYNAQIEQYRAEVALYDSRITQNANDIDTLEAKLPSGNFSSTNTVKKYVDDKISDVSALLPASQYTSTNTVKKAIDNVNSQISGIDETITEYDRHYVGLVGDSFTKVANDSYNGYWTNRLHYAYGYELVNKAVNGTGFVEGTSSTNFQAQFNAVLDDSHFEQMEYIIVYGGLNDFTHLSAPDPDTTMKNAFTAIRDAYINKTSSMVKMPKLIFAFGNLGRIHRSIYNGYMTWYNKCMNVLRDIGMPGLVDYVPFWHVFLPDTGSAYFEDDGTHPNQKGQWIISSFMESIISGSYCGVHRSYEYGLSTFQSANFTNLTAGRIQINFDNGTVSFDIGCTCDSFNTASGGVTQITGQLGNVSAFIGNYNDAPTKQAFVYAGNPLMDSNGNFAPVYYNTNNGIIYARHEHSGGKSKSFPLSQLGGTGHAMAG